MIDFRIRTYKEWEDEYDELMNTGEKHWAVTGLDDDIRGGWEKASNNNGLYSCGLFKVPLEVVESIEKDRQHGLKLCGIKSTDLEHELASTKSINNYLWNQLAELTEKITKLKAQLYYPVNL